MKNETKQYKSRQSAYNARQDSITIRPSKEQGTKIRAAAAAAGQSVQAWMLQAAQERLNKDKFNADFPPAKSTDTM